MTLEITALLVLLATMVYLFLTEKLPVDLTAFAGLVILIFAGYVTPAEAFAGFSSPAVITMLSIFVVSAGLLYTGVADSVGRRLHHLVGTREAPLVVTLSLLAALLSAFMNNIAATAVLMPAVASLAARARISPSRLFMPLAFGAILGGTTTLVGTPPNILAGELLAERGLTPFGLFEFTPLGLALLAAGTLYMVTVGRWLIPTRAAAGAAGGKPGPELAQLYQVQDKLFALQIPEHSSLVGRILGETGIGTALGVRILSLQRRGAPRQVPRAETVLASGDRLLLHGRRRAVEELLDLQGLEAVATRVEDLPRPGPGAAPVPICPRRRSSLGKLSVSWPCANVSASWCSLSAARGGCCGRISRTRPSWPGRDAAPGDSGRTGRRWLSLDGLLQGRRAADRRGSRPAGLLGSPLFSLRAAELVSRAGSSFDFRVRISRRWQGAQKQP